jgi:hypothetical protein
MHRNRLPSFSIDPTRQREGIRERWSPLTDDGGDLRSRRRDEPDARARETSREDAALPLREEGGSSS